MNYSDESWEYCGEVGEHLEVRKNLGESVLEQFPDLGTDLSRGKQIAILAKATRVFVKGLPKEERKRMRKSYLSEVGRRLVDMKPWNLVKCFVQSKAQNMIDKYHPWEKSEKEIGELILGMEVVKKRDKVFDFGGGGALYQKMLVGSVPETRIVSFDIREYEPKEGIETRKVDVKEIECDGKADVIIASRLFNNMDDEGRSLVARKFRENLKEGGRLVVSYEVEKTSPHLHDYTKQIHRDLESLGFVGGESQTYCDRGEDNRQWLFKTYQLSCSE